MAEFDWIDKYLSPIATSPDAMGLRDDVARLSGGETGATKIVTMDTLVEAIHFLPDDPLYKVGQKLARVNISDVICKGALPRQALLSVAMPASFTEENFESLCAGLGRDLEVWDIDLLGGDLVTTNGPLVLTLAVTAECLGAGPIKRSGAKPGDIVYVSGVVGAGKAGLDDARTRVESSAARHYRVPSIPGKGIADMVSRFANASIDISDGLIAEARHIGKASKVSLEIDLNTVPWFETVYSLERALELATGGDDYQTMMTIPASLEEAFSESLKRHGLSMSRIGKVVEGQDVRVFWNGENVLLSREAGYQH
ncbi:thiamine-phosphate kinase [Henriciella sp.]|uniref:thiamine-phosphate kinase n=1 Tax=Henriciella sp. TaxID=1968823 RepID=UPI00260D2D28|nr:thiamine-phosphate kinase [Henriciella sp.]